LIVADAAAPKAVELACVDRTGGMWRNIEAWPQAKCYPGLFVFEFRGPLSFASAEWFKEEIERLRSISEVRSGAVVGIIILSFYSVTSIDHTSLSMLQELLLMWKGQNIGCIVANAKGQVKQLLKEEFSYGDKPCLDQDEFMLNITDAVKLARRRLELQKIRRDAKNKNESAARIQRLYRRNSLYKGRFEHSNSMPLIDVRQVTP